MARARKLTPGDELAEVDARIAALVAEGEALSARQGDAEAMIRSFADRRENAVVLVKLGEQVEVPGEAEQARLQQFVANAKVEHYAIGRARRQLEEDRIRVVAAGLPYFDGEAEDAARAFEAEGEALLAGLDAFLNRQRVKGEAWRRGWDGRRELGREQMPGVSYDDLGDVRGKITDALRGAWPGGREERWRAFRAREQAPPAARMRNAEAIAQFGGEAA
jgi:hypothetical protein